MSLTTASTRCTLRTTIRGQPLHHDCECRTKSCLHPSGQIPFSQTPVHAIRGKLLRGSLQDVAWDIFRCEPCANLSCQPLHSVMLQRIQHMTAGRQVPASASALQSPRCHEDRWATQEGSLATGVEDTAPSKEAVCAGQGDRRTRCVSVSGDGR